MLRVTRAASRSQSDGRVLVAYGQNGEAVRPEQGYPLRLLVPGWEGNVNVKWLSQVRVVEMAQMSRSETAKYVDLMPDGKSWQFSFVMEAKSVITRPAGGQSLLGPVPMRLPGLPGRVEGGSRGWRSLRMAEGLGRCGPELSGIAQIADAICGALGLGWPRGGFAVAVHR